MKRMDRDSRWEGVDCIRLAQDKDQWQALMNTVMNLRGSIKGGETDWLNDF
jgi:hypothetical protein